MSPSDIRHALTELARDADAHHPADRLASVRRRARRTARTRAVAGATAAVVVVLGGTWAARAAWSPEAVGPTSPTTTNQPTTAPLTPTWTPTPTHAATPTPTPTSTQSSPTPPSAVGACAPGSLTMRLGTEEGTAGSMYVPVVFTNPGSTSCTLEGYPVVQLAAARGGSAIGAVATHDPGYAPTKVRLAPGAEAAALVRIVDAMNFPPSKCKVESATVLRATGPGAAASGDLALASATPACSSPIAQLFVRPVVPGSTGL